jgi:hypothetical protein
MLKAPAEGDRHAAPSPGGAPRPLAEQDPPETAAPLPRPALAYVLGVFAVGLASIAWFAPRLDPDHLPGFLIFAVLAIALGRTKLQIYGDTTVSIAVVSDVAIAFLFGPDPPRRSRPAA